MVLGKGPDGNRFHPAPVICSIPAMSTAPYRRHRHGNCNEPRVAIGPAHARAMPITVHKKPITVRKKMAPPRCRRRHVSPMLLRFIHCR